MSPTEGWKVDRLAGQLVGAVAKKLDPAVGDKRMADFRWVARFRFERGIYRAASLHQNRGCESRSVGIAVIAPARLSTGADLNAMDCSAAGTEEEDAAILRPSQYR